MCDNCSISVKEMVSQIKKTSNVRTPQQRKEMLFAANILGKDGEYLPEYFPYTLSRQVEYTELDYAIMYIEYMYGSGAVMDMLDYIEDKKRGDG